MTITEMREYLGTSRVAFSRLYKIPVRTLENWESGARKPPEYILYLLERAVKGDKENLALIAAERQIEEISKENKSVTEIINNGFL